jgi:hypothetical protein
MVPAGPAGVELTLPALVATVYAPSPPPFTVLLLRNPTDRLWTSFWAYGQYADHYGATLEGFQAYFAEQSAMWRRCVTQHDVRLCALRFETLGAEFNALFYHADQLIKGTHDHGTARSPGCMNQREASDPTSEAAGRPSYL